ncbi:hypothetical protein [Massilia sp. TWR1-2-2]|uniref:hypothetical protein n=1 Tax=Massilia sp. TWR1-2-2 TaxID=2804584 RepID=UPI003CF2FAA5
MPPLTSEFLNIIKNSSVALTIGLVELTASARAIQQCSFQVFEAFSAATIICLVINMLVASLMQLLEKRVAVPGFTVAAAKVQGPLTCSPVSTSTSLSGRVATCSAPAWCSPSS